MRSSFMLHVVPGFTAAVLMVTSGAVFAMGGGNGQGGTGGGNSHSAATAGMTYRGDPITSPMATMPGNTAGHMDSGDATMQGMPVTANDAMAPQKSTQ
ncbi:MAG TPA: hypothetical protein VFE79_11555 [Paraburkholderia sp.]|nr:hypothetical protein [Paraburkholderia sp.]